MSTYGTGTYGAGTYGSAGIAGRYDLALGPLRFVTAIGPMTEQLGDALEAVGAVLTPSDPRPRPFKLTLPVRGDAAEPDPAVVGHRLRRQLRQLLQNARWRSSGLYLHLAADPELDGWLLVGGGDLQETDAGVDFGEWTVELNDCYLVGRPARQRLGRRLELGDRRSGLVALDTRGLLYSTDHAAQALPTQPLVIPGDTAAELLSRNRPPSSIASGPTIAGRRLWKALGGALDGDVASFVPALFEDNLIAERALEYVELEAIGGVRVWDTTASTIEVDAGALAYTAAGDDDPARYGWERILGDPLVHDAPLAIDNGICRLVWTLPFAASSTPGLALEVRNTATGLYERLGAVTGTHTPGSPTAVREVTVIELGPERAVIEWRAGALALRAILQRGWRGPRLEAYNDSAANATLSWAPRTAGLTDLAAQTPSWVKGFTDNAGNGVLFALGRDSDTVTNLAAGGAFGAAARRMASSAGPIVVQVAPAAGITAAELASLAIADARSIPVLVSR